MLDGKSIFKINKLLDNTKELGLYEIGWMHRLVVRLNDVHWKPLSWPTSSAMEGMGKNSFLRMRTRLAADGWILWESREETRQAAIYQLGPKFNELKKSNMRTRDEIKELVIAIDRKYPVFAELCNRYKWDNAVESFKVSHPDVGVWEADSIGDPVNRKQAHGMFVSIHRKRKERGSAPAKEPDATIKATRENTHLLDTPWGRFKLCVDQWKMTYVRDGGRTCKRVDLQAAVDEFIKGKENWTEEQIGELWKKIEQHTAEYLRHTEPKYLCSPPNYFLKEQWTETVKKNRDKDTDMKHAGAPVVTNMPVSKVTRVN